MSARPLHHQRPLFAVSAAYGLGVWAGARFFWRPWLYALGLALSAAVLALLPRAGRRRVAGAMGLFLFLGALLGGFASHPVLPEAGVCDVTAVVSADAVLREDGTAACYLESASIHSGAGDAGLPRLYWTYPPDPEAPFLPREGDRVEFSGRLYELSGQVNPYGFDFRMYLLIRGVPMGASGAKDAAVLDHPGRGLASVTYHARQWLENRLEAIFGPEDCALPQALLLGQRDKLPEETRRSFADAGVAHLLAVSGLHVGLLALAVNGLLRRLAPPKAQLALLGAFLLFYSALLDFSAPVVRASLILMVMQLQRRVRRAPDGLTALSAAFLLILLVHPLSLFSASFQLSFLAVLGLVTLGPILRRRVEHLRPAWLWNGVCATLSATVGSFLPTVQLYHRFSLVGLLINPLLCALFAVLLPLYAGTLLLGSLWLDAAALVARGVNLMTRGLLAAVEWLSALPFSTVRVPFLPWYCVLAVGAALLLCTRYTLLQRRQKIMLGLCALVCAFGLWGLTACRDAQYIQLAVGQADCALILDGKDTWVIDAGAYGGDLAAFLLCTGRNADHLVLSHLHRDHCLGVRQLLDQRIGIGRVYLPEGAEEQEIDEECRELLNALRDRGVPVEFLAAGDRIESARVTLTVTWPERGRVRPGRDANRYALASLIDLDGVLLLTASDLTGDYELYAARDADVLKAAHHGSKASTSEAFLDVVSPSVALITGGRPGGALPSAETLERLENTGARVYNTGVCGAVTLTVRNGAAFITSFLP